MDFDISTVRSMISFLYTGEYQVLPIEQIQSSSTVANIEASEPSLADTMKEGDQMTETLLLHLRVNAIADYYDIKSMAALANSNIRSILENTQDADLFSRFVLEASNSTGDVVLHSIIASTAANRIEELTESQAFLDIELGNNLSIGILRGCAERIRELQNQLKHIQMLRASESLRNNHIIENIDNCVRTMKETNECRHCEASFACYIEKHGKELEPSYTLRCEECRCRHRPN